MLSRRAPDPRLPRLDAGDEGASGRRAVALRRWLDLTRRVLPAMARERDWPISLDHCFMRVCLDAILGAPWTRTVSRPAIRHLSEDQLEAAVRVAESIATHPETLRALNEASLRGRAAQRRASTLAGNQSVPGAG